MTAGRRHTICGWVCALGGWVCARSGLWEGVDGHEAAAAVKAQEERAHTGDAGTEHQRVGEGLRALTQAGAELAPQTIAACHHVCLGIRRRHVALHGRSYFRGAVRGVECTGK